MFLIPFSSFLDVTLFIYSIFIKFKIIFISLFIHSNLSFTLCLVLENSKKRKNILRKLIFFSLILS